MIPRLISALMRALLVVVLIATPSLILPGMEQDVTQVVVLIALFGAILTLVEYGSNYPSLVEFRDAPPFNRIRFFSLFITVFLLSVLCLGQFEPTTLTMFVEAVGRLIGHAIDFPYSPVRLVLVSLPESASPVDIDLVRAAAGLSYLISLLTLAIFVIFLRVTGWPSPATSFNVWINLPTFEPTAGGDVVDRLERDARVNVALGFILPFVSPIIFGATHVLFEPISQATPHTLVWTMATWAFLPASLFMRGIAMARISEMIREERKRAEDEERGLAVH